MEPLGNQGLRRLGAEVAQEYHQGVDAVGLHVADGLLGLDLVLHGDRALVEAPAVGGLQGGPAALAQRGGEAGAADGDDAQLDFRDVLHNNFLLIKLLFNF